MLTPSDVQPRELFTKELLIEFFHADPRDWRLRQVVQISPLDPESYLARTSFQFRLSAELIHAAWERAFRDVDQPPLPPRDNIEIILPIDYLPKYVLLNFSLEDHLGKPLALFTSGDSSRLSLGIVGATMAVLDELAADRADTAVAFFREFEPIILALISAGQREIPRRLRSLSAFPQTNPSRAAFCSGMLAFYDDALSQFTGQPNLSIETRDVLRPMFLEIHQLIGTVTEEATRLLGGADGHHSPLLNPALLIMNYLRIKPARAPDQIGQHLADYLAQCRRFIQAVAMLQADELRFAWATKLLSRLSRYYVAYSRLTVPIERDFVIKMEHVIPMEMEWWRRFIGGWREQWYPFRIGDMRSTHIEVTSTHPIELEQIPRATRLLIGQSQSQS